MLIDAYQWQSVPILSKILESRDAVSLIVAKPRGYYFMPGQHAIVRISTADGTHYVRQYSYSSTSSDTAIRLTITRQPGGIVSSWCIDTAHIGDTIELSQPFTGPLAIDASAVTRLGMVAGGSGIAPMMSHILTLRETAPAQTRVVLYSTRQNMRCFTSTLVANGDETIDVRLTDEQTRFQPHEIRRALLSCERILICGSRPFVTDMQALCHQYLPDAALHCESFSL